jgi:hypothetical protein
MATRYATIKGVRVAADCPMGSEKGGVLIVSFDLAGTVYTGGADTVQLGGGGTDGTLAVGSATLAALIAANHTRDGKTYVLYTSGNPNVAPGNQAAATNGPLIYAQSAAVSSGNVTLNLFSAPTGGSAITCTAGAWERAMEIVLNYTAS